MEAEPWISIRGESLGCAPTRPIHQNILMERMHWGRVAAMSAMAHHRPPPAREAELTDLTALCKALGDPLRAQILRVLAGDAYSVAELCHVFHVRQPALSHHLKVLVSAGLVTPRREGTFVFYRRAPRLDDHLDGVRTLLGRHLDEYPLEPAIAQRLVEVERERAGRSLAFFHRHAAEFREQQDLIAAHPQYGDTVIELLDAVRRSQDRHVIEVGPGEGELLAALAPRFARVTALDNSPAMLARAQNCAAAHQLTNVDFVSGDTTTGIAQGLRAPVITLNMVLHHNASPARMLRDLAAMLEPGGSLLVSELCAHHQDWARAACGDLWLGFEPEQLDEWAAAAGLSPGDGQFLALRNGFRIQIRQFIRLPVPGHDARP